MEKQESTKQPPPRRLPAWDRATKAELEDYKANLQARLQAVQCPASLLHCHNTNCQDQSHSETRDNMVLDLLLTIVETSYTSLPLEEQAARTARER